MCLYIQLGRPGTEEYVRVKYFYMCNSITCELDVNGGDGNADTVYEWQMVILEIFDDWLHREVKGSFSC